MSSEPHHSPDLWRWRQPQAYDQCPQWSCPPGSSPCPLCWCIYLQMIMLSYLSVYQSDTCNDDNCAGTGNIHPMTSRNKIENFFWVCISQSHPNLTVRYHQICRWFSFPHVHMRFNLRPGKRSLVAKIEDEASVHDVMALDPRNRFTYKLQFFSVR